MGRQQKANRQFLYGIKRHLFTSLSFHTAHNTSVAHIGSLVYCMHTSSMTRPSLTARSTVQSQLEQCAYGPLPLQLLLNLPLNLPLCLPGLQQEPSVPSAGCKQCSTIPCCPLAIIVPKQRGKCMRQDANMSSTHSQWCEALCCCKGFHKQQGRCICRCERCQHALTLV